MTCEQCGESSVVTFTIDEAVTLCLRCYAGPIVGVKIEKPKRKRRKAT